jgi:hypothetical protein
MRHLLLALLPLLTGCVTGSWSRTNRFAPPDEGAVETLAPGQSDLGHCLAALGAPLWVWEYRGDGVALAYGWLEDVGWGIIVSVPLTEYYSASFDYRDRDSEMPGLVLLFDEGLTLRELRRGLLRDLTREVGRPRPNLVE